MRSVRIIETGEEFKSLAECARFLDGKVEHVYQCLHGRLRKYRGFTFEYVDLSVPYLKMGRAIKSGLRGKTEFDVNKFVEEMSKKSEK